ncbi:fluoride efflux transporter FluC [Agromyces seonyuensis]|uniref:Fluoride-specific ion channel FluC n=1 Tax=Agromyces seonyuensis TaxID=2662446 RepID=A0A6I4NYU1_9MICO|nr:CrcB family protein [Agromyces seonyuensis]MWB99476.1 camphor resistance protein CrcB [Agromyces seonyuensis]
MTLLLAALAGGLGAAARFLVDTFVARWNRTSFPLGTIVVNTTACFLLGLLTGWTAAVTAPGAVAAIFGVGFLGGYSTFSTAMVEGARLVRQRRPWAAIAHSGGMLVLGLGAAALGLLVFG